MKIHITKLSENLLFYYKKKYLEGEEVNRMDS